MGARRVWRRAFESIGGGEEVEVEGVGEGSGFERTTDSDSRETGSPIVVSFASFDRDGLGERFEGVVLGVFEEAAPRSWSVGDESADSAFRLVGSPRRVGLARSFNLGFLVL